ncbi:MAG: DUF4905 domain-containing protein [Cyclobacteriaceae bacterium]
MPLLYSQQFGNVIRSLKLSSNQKLLCIESTHDKNAIPSYSVYNLETNKLLTNSQEVKGSNTIVIKHIHENILLLNEYDNNKNPDDSTVIAFDYINNSIAWESQQIKIIDVTGGYIRAPHPNFPQRISHVDIKTGLIVDLEEEGSEPLNKKTKLPLMYSESSEYFDYFKKYIQDQSGNSAVICCEYLESNTNMIISYYTQKGQTLSNYLMVAEKEGRVTEQIKLGENLQGIGKDTFFALEENLFFITNKNTLNIYEL